MDDELPPIRILLIEEIEFLRTRGVAVVISDEGKSRRYWIDGEEVSESDLVAQAYILGMPGHEQLQ